MVAVKINDTLYGRFHGPVHVIKLLSAGGGQGRVYIARQGSSVKALKIYKASGMGKNKDAFIKNLIKNVQMGTPASNFLWPEDVVLRDNNVIGYTMPLAPKGYHELPDFLLSKVHFPSLIQAIDAALNIAASFRVLHNRGFSYQDLNDGSFFINPTNGRVLICDNDNVCPEGSHTGVLGKPGYVAPEIITGADRTPPVMPDVKTDRFSMAVILFMLFTLTRPFEGRRCFRLKQGITDQFLNNLYGPDAHFIMEHPKDRRLGPDPERQANATAFWKILPEYMRQIFLKSLGSSSVQDPFSRPTELDWIQALSQFRGQLITCPCESVFLYKKGRSVRCPDCHKEIEIPYSININGKQTIPVQEGLRLFKGQFGICNATETLAPVGLIIKHADSLYLVNLSNETLSASNKHGTFSVLPKDAVPVSDSLTITINSSVINVTKN